MDYSKYIQMKMKAANTYKSNWQGRDASEITMRRQAIGNSGNQSTHQGPINVCDKQFTKTPPTETPGNGFSTDYSMDIVSNKKAGGAMCNDAVFGAPGGVNLISCAEVSTILYVPPNPGSTSCACADPGVPFHAVVDPVRASPAYSGWRNHVPVTGTGVRPIQVQKYPSA